jgi:hypothetical protein
MSDAENFLSRWARRKSEAETPSPTESSVAQQPDIQAEASPDPENLDLASLPSVDSITGTTDISGFLRSGVPPELTRSALRQAWARDPAIRDFIGIAENQWDFNDPNTIPGFGLLGATDDVPALLAQALGQVERVAEAIPNPADLPRLTPAVIAPQDELPEQAPDEIPPGVGAANEEVAVQSSLTTTDEEARPDHRRHGSALPR